MYPYLGESQFRVNHYSFLRKEKAAVWNNEACGKQQVFLFVLVTSKVLYMLMSVVFSLLQPLSAPWPTPWGLSVMIIFSFYYAVHNKWPIRLFELMSKWMKTKILCFLEIHFWRKKKSLTCICRGDIYFRVGTNPPRLEKETRDKGEEEVKMQMRWVTEDESRKLDGVWS